VSDLDAFKTIHRIGSGFNKSIWYQRFNESEHPGIFTMIDPKQHATRRRLFAQPFSNSSVLTFESAVRQKVELAVIKIKRDAQAGSADILKWFTFMATDVSGELSFGKSFDMLQQEQVRITLLYDHHGSLLLMVTVEKPVYPGLGDCIDGIRHTIRASTSAHDC